MLIKFNQVRIHLKNEEEEKQSSIIGNYLEEDYMSSLVIDISAVIGYSMGHTIFNGKRLECIYPLLKNLGEVGNIIISEKEFQSLLNIYNKQNVVDLNAVKSYQKK